MKKINELYKKYKEIFNYIIVGALTTFISLLSFYVSTIIFNPNNPVLLQISNIISWVCSVTFAYFANRKYVFESKNKHVLKEGLNFYCARIMTLLLDMFFMFILVTLLNLNSKLAKLLVQVLILFCNYIISKFYVFKRNGLKEVK